MKKYSRVTYAERCQIFILLQSKISIPAIARQLKRHKTTIYREIERNSTKRSMYKDSQYDGDKAHIKARKRFLDSCRRPLKVDGELKEFVTKGLQVRWSPELIAGRIRREKKISLSHMTIYRFVRRNPGYSMYLLHQGHRFPSNRNNFGATRSRFLSIHERSKDCAERRSLGHWERDLMYAKDRTPVLVCADRKSRFTLIERLQAATALETQQATKSSILSTGRPPKSVTNDNGSEFFMQTGVGCKVYFCDPGKPQQRGTVENTIGVLRRFIKNDTDLDKINLRTLETWMNNRPRKVLDYRTPYEVMYKQKVAMVV